MTAIDLRAGDRVHTLSGGHHGTVVYVGSDGRFKVTYDGVRDRTAGRKRRGGTYTYTPHQRSGLRAGNAARS